jgi:hypothetical protein
VVCGYIYSHSGPALGSVGIIGVTLYSSLTPLEELNDLQEEKPIFHEADIRTGLPSALIMILYHDAVIHLGLKAVGG